MKMRMNLFRRMVMDLWNSLPQTAVEPISLGIFKAEINRCLISKDDKGNREKAGDLG